MLPIWKQIPMRTQRWKSNSAYPKCCRRTSTVCRISLQAWWCWTWLERISYTRMAVTSQTTTLCTGTGVWVCTDERVWLLVRTLYSFSGQKWTENEHNYIATIKLRYVYSKLIPNTILKTIVKIPASFVVISIGKLGRSKIGFNNFKYDRCLETKPDHPSP